VQALLVYIAGMEKRQIQYTIRKVPPELDSVVRERAAQYGQSMNDVLIDALKKGLGATDQPFRNHDLDDFIGTWVDDPEFDKAIADMDRIDPDLWK
jgi:hypothetical protein